MCPYLIYVFLRLFENAEKKSHSKETGPQTEHPEPVRKTSCAVAPIQTQGAYSSAPILVDELGYLKCKRA